MDALERIEIERDCGRLPLLFARYADNGDHASLARDHDRARRRVLRNGRDRGDVAGTAEILGQCARDHRVDLQRREEGVGAEQGCGHDGMPGYGRRPVRARDVLALP